MFNDIKSNLHFEPFVHSRKFGKGLLRMCIFNFHDLLDRLQDLNENNLGIFISSGIDFLEMNCSATSRRLYY